MKRQILTHKAVSGLPLWLFTARSEQQFNLLFNSQFLIGKLSTVTLWSKRVNQHAGAARHKAGPAERTGCEPQTQSRQRRGRHTQTRQGDFCTTAAMQLGTAKCVGLVNLQGLHISRPLKLTAFLQQSRAPFRGVTPKCQPVLVSHLPSLSTIHAGGLSLPDTFKPSILQDYTTCGAGPPLLSSIPLFYFSFFPRT